MRENEKFDVRGLQQLTGKLYLVLFLLFEDKHALVVGFAAGL